MKRLPIFLLVLTFVFISLTSCGGNADSKIKENITENIDYQLHDLRVVEEEKNLFAIIGTLGTGYELSDFIPFTQKLIDVSNNAASDFGASILYVNTIIYTEDESYIGWSSENGDFYNQDMFIAENVSLDELQTEIDKLTSPSSEDEPSTENEEFQFGDRLDIFQGEWKHNKINTRIIINDNEVNSIHYDLQDKNEVAEINTFYFAIDDSENLIVTNEFHQPRYTFSIDEDGFLIKRDIGGTDEDIDVYEKVSDNTEVPIIKADPSIGMSEDDVLLSTWGYPHKKNKTTTASGTREQWVYEDGYIYFDNGIVTAIQEKS